MFTIPVHADAEVSVKEQKKFMETLCEFFKDTDGVQVVENPNPCFKDDSFVHLICEDVEAVEGRMDEMGDLFFDKYGFAVTRPVNRDTDDYEALTEGVFLVDQMGMWDEFYCLFGKDSFIRNYGQDSFELYAKYFHLDVA